jgi:hypothetical protein
MSKLQARNEAVINASVSRIWSVITDIKLLSKINPGVLKATGRMDMLGESRICEFANNGKKGIMTERLINESYYLPANLMVFIMNKLMMKRKMKKIQDRILTNIKSLTEHGI